MEGVQPDYEAFVEGYFDRIIERYGEIVTEVSGGDERFIIGLTRSGRSSQARIERSPTTPL